MEATNKQQIIKSLKELLTKNNLEEVDKKRIKAKLKALENNEIVTK